MRRLIRLLSAVVMGLALLAVLAGAGLLYLLNSYGGGLPDHLRQLQLTRRDLELELVQRTDLLATTETNHSRDTRRSLDR